jgi:NADH dehydrogenase FAD-containing subunit
MPHFTNIVVLGASYAGLTITHKLLRKTIRELRIPGSALRYRVILISPSTHLYWNISAPRAICDVKYASKRSSFIPFVDEFQEYSEEEFTFIQGEAISVNCLQRLVTVKSKRNKLSEGSLREIDYHALIIATGSSSHSNLLSLHGSHHNTVEAFEAFQAKLKGARRIVIAGGGPSGVEVR